MSRRLALLRPLLRGTVRPLLARTSSWTFARRAMDLASLGFAGTRGSRAVSLPPALGPGLEVLPPEVTGPGVVLYLHGGAYVMGGSRSYRPLAAALAARCGRPVILPDYPLVPEHPAPAAFEAALAVWEGLRAEHGAARNVLAGDSAGGGLALAVLAALLARGERPAGCLAFSPWTDLTLSGASLRVNARRDVLLPAARLAEVRDMVRGGLAPEDPRISPLLADFPGCPPVRLCWSESEILRDDAARMAARLEACGAVVEREVLPDAPHVWQLFHGRVPEADVSLEAAGRFIAAALRAPRPAGS
jgi:acetyl esterase/lipase